MGRPIGNHSVGRIGEVLHHIGDRSYGIFYIQCFILMILTRLCNHIGLSDVWILKLIFCFVLTSVLSVLAVDGVNAAVRTLKIEKALKWIGF